LNQSKSVGFASAQKLIVFDIPKTNGFRLCNGNFCYHVALSNAN